ncbi:hypothetical protein KV580_26805 [Pseudomonas chlororaphis]|nr:hypothetical protein [Pseudomonas chlororaphis]
MMTLEAVSVFLLLFLLFFSLGLSAYITKTKLDLVEAYFDNNEMMIGDRKWWGGKSYKHRSMRLCLIGIVIMFPRVFIWRRLVTQQELDAIPQGLKRWSKAPLYLEIPLFFGMIAFWIWHPFQ